jgi:hypothetical protein
LHRRTPYTHAPRPSDQRPPQPLARTPTKHRNDPTCNGPQAHARLRDPLRRDQLAGRSASWNVRSRPLGKLERAPPPHSSRRSATSEQRTHAALLFGGHLAPIVEEHSELLGLNGATAVDVAARKEHAARTHTHPRRDRESESERANERVDPCQSTRHTSTSRLKSISPALQRRVDMVARPG